MNILAFESSCDDTAVALVAVDDDAPSDSVRVLAHQMHSQVDLHALYGGVVPELASRDHIRAIGMLTASVMKEAQIHWDDIDYLAYTIGPGLAGALMVAASFAESLAFSLQKPIIPVHHLEGHILSPLLAANPPQWPFVALLISGGHSQFYAVKGAGDYELLGESVDDAAGEAFDKTAKLLGLPYPGGHYLESLAQKHSPTTPNRFHFPRPMLHSGDINMSFSGLKTAVWQALHKINTNNGHASTHTLTDEDEAQIAYEFQEAIVEVLVAKALRACQQTNIKKLTLCGGVARNSRLRTALQEATAALGIVLFDTPKAYCTDNAAMIGQAARFHTARARPAGGFSVRPHWPVGQ